MERSNKKTFCSVTNACPHLSLSLPPTAGPGVGHDSTVWDIAFDPEGRRMMSCSDDRTLKIWECAKEEGG